MRLAIRALGWTIYILWLVIIVFTVTAVYSAFQIGVSFSDEPRTSVSGGTMTLSLPFSFENNGFYDISNLNITTIIQEINGVLVSNSSTVVPLISRGDKVDATHNISVSLEKMTSASLSRLLFNDTDFNVDLSLALRYAGVIPLKISTNSTMTWGAPLYNLDIGNIPPPEPNNATHINVVLPLSFENHSFFNLNGTMRIVIMNMQDQPVGFTTTPIIAPSQSVYSNQFRVPVQLTYGSFKEVHLYFDTSVFSYGPKVISIA